MWPKSPVLSLRQGLELLLKLFARTADAGVCVGLCRADFVPLLAVRGSHAVSGELVDEARREKLDGLLGDPALVHLDTDARPRLLEYGPAELRQEAVPVRAPGAVTEPAAALRRKVAFAQARPQDGAAPHADYGRTIELVVENLWRESYFLLENCISGNFMKLSIFRVSEKLVESSNYVPG